MSANYKSAAEEVVEENRRTIQEVDALELSARVKKRVIGQDEGVEWLCRYLSMAVARTQAILKKNYTALEVPRCAAAAIVGPTASGKTYLVKVVAEELGLMFHMINGANLTREGWRGNTLASELAVVAKRLESEPDALAVIVVDEADKLVIDSRWECSSAAYDFLAPLDGGVYTAEADRDGRESFSIDMDRCIVLFAGAFTGIEDHIRKRLLADARLEGEGVELWSETKLRRHASPEDLHLFGLPRELIGRIFCVKSMDALTADALSVIVKGADNSLERRYGRLLPEGVAFSVSQEAAGHLAREAQRSGYGARKLDRLLSTPFGIAQQEAIRDERIASVEIVLEEGGLKPVFTRGKKSHKAESGFSRQRIGASDAKEGVADREKLALARSRSDEDVRAQLDGILASLAPLARREDKDVGLQEVAALIVGRHGKGQTLDVALATDLCTVALSIAVHAFPKEDWGFGSLYVLLGMMEFRKSRSPFDIIHSESGRGLKFNPSSPDGEGEWAPYDGPVFPDALFTHLYIDLKRSYGTDQLARACALARDELLALTFDGKRQETFVEAYRELTDSLTEDGV